MNNDASFGRAWRWIAVVGVLLASLLAWMLLARGTPQGRVADTVDAPSAQFPTISQAHPTIDVQRAAEPKGAPAVVDDLCGVTGSDRARAGNETLDQHVARLTQYGIRRWKDALAASEDPRRHAIGVALSNAQPGVHIPTPDELVPGNEPSRDTPINNNLVLLATETGDPAIYSLAIGQCRTGTETNDMASGPCQGLSWEHWADIDPDNGMPWLWIAAKADRAGDQQAVEEALGKAASASRIEAYGSALSTVALGALPGDAAPLEKAVAGADVISVLRVGTPMEIISLCSATAIHVTRRKQECSAIAETLAKQGSNLMLAAILADQLGFPQEVRRALWLEAKNARAVLIKNYPWRPPGEDAEFRCDTVLAYDHFIDALREGNERTARAVASMGANSNSWRGP